MEAAYSLPQTVFGILKTLVVRATQNNLDLTYDVVPDIPDQFGWRCHQVYAVKGFACCSQHASSC
jgi:hypothetical protein